MKKLGKKGFTLVELLAVIVILTVIVLIAVRSVINTMNTAKKKAYLTDVQKWAKMVQEQQMLSEMDSSYKVECGGKDICEATYNAKAGNFEDISIDASGNITIKPTSSLQKVLSGETFKYDINGDSITESESESESE